MSKDTKPKSNYKNKADIDWQALGREYCAGASVNSLSNKYKVDRVSIDKQIKKNEWKQDVSAIISKEVAAKVAGVSYAMTPEQKTVAIDDESTRRADKAKSQIRGIETTVTILSSLQSVLKYQTNAFVAKAQNKEVIDAKELETHMRTVKMHNEAFISAQAREALVNGIDLLPSSKVDVTMNDDSFANILLMAAKAKANS